MPTALINTDVPVTHTPNVHKRRYVPDDKAILAAQHCEAARLAIEQWPGYEPTPLISLDGIAKSAGVASVLLKDEAPRFGLGSFKALGGAYAVSKILMSHLQQKLGHPVTLNDLSSGEHSALSNEIAVSCATDGNHGRSVAWGAQQFGCPCIIYIHSEVSEGRKSAIEHFGASVIRVEGNYDDSVRIADEQAKLHNRIVVSDTSYPGYTQIPADVMRGYTVLADEAFEQMNGVVPTHVFLQGGVGGFAAAITARIRDHFTEQQPRIVVVEPDQAACINNSIAKGEPVAVHGELATIMAGLACGEVSLIAFDVLLRCIDDVLVIPDESAIATMQLLASGSAGDQPLVSGESGVTGLAGFALASGITSLSGALGLDSNSRVLIISTEGATDPVVYEALVGRAASEIA